MKELKVIKFICVLILSVVLVNMLNAQSIGITSPTNNAVLVLPSCQSQMNVSIQYYCNPITVDQTNGRTESGYTGSWYVEICIDNVCQQVPTNPGLNTFNKTLSGGYHLVVATLYQEYYDATPGWEGYSWDQFVSSVYFRIVSNGTCTASAAQSGPGEKIDSKTSCYISPGSSVAYNLQLRGYANTSGVFASAGIWNGSVNLAYISKNITHSDGYYYNQQTGTITNFAGGTIICQGDARVTAGYSGNSSGVATITW